MAGLLFFVAIGSVVLYGALRLVETKRAGGRRGAAQVVIWIGFAGAVLPLAFGGIVSFNAPPEMGRAAIVLDVFSSPVIYVLGAFWLASAYAVSNSVASVLREHRSSP